MGMMFRALRGSPVARTLVALGVTVVAVIVATAYGQIQLNSWNKPFYDALSRRDLHDFVYQLGVFFVIATAILILNVAQRWLVEMLKLKLREGIVHDLLRDWMLPRRAFWLANAGGPMGVNPDQRMHEDARKLCELSSDLGTGLLQATILFSIFAGVLWTLSSGFTVRFHDRDYDPGVHVVGGRDPCVPRLPAQLLGGSQPDQSQLRPVCPRGRSSFLTGSHQRASGWHFARRW